MSELAAQEREKQASDRAKALGLGTLRFEAGRDLLLAGYSQRYDEHTRATIPALWNKFPEISKVLGRIGELAYGACWNANDNCEFDYMAGVEVDESAKLPQGFTLLRIPARRYVVITHTGPVSKLPQTIDAVWSRWAPQCGLKIADAPCYELYTEEFNPNGGGMELWIPLDE